MPSRRSIATQPASRPGPLAPPRRDGLTGTRLEIARADAAPRRVAGRRLPRARALLAVGLLGIVAAAVADLAGIYTDVLWFRELGHDRALWTTLEFKVLAHGPDASRYVHIRPRRQPSECLDRVEALADKHGIDRDFARRLAAELHRYEEAA
jgi:hypothetical protein